MSIIARARFLLTAAVALSALLFQASPAFAATGAIFTTDSACSGVNVNIFNSKSDVYLDGGPHGNSSTGLPDGSYYVQVTTPDGTVLGKTTGATVVVSGGKFASCYPLSVILTTASSGFTIAGYDDTTNGGGEYKVWASLTPTFDNGTNKTDNFKVKSAPVQPQVGSISGLKWQDMNANGAQDAGDTGLSGWSIQLWNAGHGSQIGSTIQTDQNGFYEFNNLTPGTYQVCEVMQSGWHASYPTTNDSMNCQTSVTVTAGSNTNNVNFGNYQNATIGGHKYQDMNGDHSVAGDPGIDGWGVNLSGASTAGTLTANGGAYSFSVKPGTYTICEGNRTGWTQTYPSGTYANSNDCGSGMQGYQVTVTSGDTSNSALDFGNFKNISISGMKFEDKNGNGSKDIGDSGLANWVIEINNGSGTTTVSTDAGGAYSFSNLGPGTYQVCEELQSGWVQTKPGAPTAVACYSIVATSGVNAVDDFGNFHTFSISGSKWNDKNHDGIWNNSEPGLANWTIGYSVNGGATTTVVTAADGSYTFSNLGPGNYLVCEVMQQYWHQTSPTMQLGTSCYSFSAQSNTNKTALNFGNALPYWCSPGFWASAAKFNIYTYINNNKKVNPPSLIAGTDLYTSISTYAPFLNPAKPKKAGGSLSQVLASPSTYGGPAFNSVADYFAYLLGWGGTQQSGENCPLNAFGTFSY